MWPEGRPRHLQRTKVAYSGAQNHGRVVLYELGERVLAAAKVLIEKFAVGWHG